MSCYKYGQWLLLWSVTYTISKLKRSEFGEVNQKGFNGWKQCALNRISMWYTFIESKVSVSYTSSSELTPLHLFQPHSDWCCLHSSDCIAHQQYWSPCQKPFFPEFYLLQIPLTPSTTYRDGVAQYGYRIGNIVKRHLDFLTTFRLT